MPPTKQDRTCPNRTVTLFSSFDDLITRDLTPASVDLGFDPRFYNLKELASDLARTVSFDGIRWFYFDWSKLLLEDVIERYSVKCKRRDLKVGDIIESNAETQKILAISNPFFNGTTDQVVTVVELDSDRLKHILTLTLPADELVNRIPQ